MAQNCWLRKLVLDRGGILHPIQFLKRNPSHLTLPAGQIKILIWYLETSMMWGRVLLYSLKTCFNHSCCAFRKSSVNHSGSGSSSSSNNSIDTKTRTSTKKFQRSTLQNVLLGPVELKHGQTFPSDFHHHALATDQVGSESSVGDPIFYYIKSSHDCPCAYHDQVTIFVWLLIHTLVDMDGVVLSSGLQGWLLEKESPFLLAQAELTLLLLWR